MKRMHIDFVARPLWCRPAAWCARATLVALGGALLLAVAALAWQTLHLDQQIAAAAQLIAQTRHELVARTPPPRPPLRLSEAQVAAINVTIGQLNTPWPAVFDAFESVVTADIALLQIEPDSRQGLVKGVAEAKDHQRMLDYLAALGSAAPFVRALVTKQEVNEKDANRPLRFAFEALLDDSTTKTAARGSAISADQHQDRR